MIKDDFKNSIAKDIAGSLTVKRRSYITKLTFQDLKAEFKNYDQLMNIFGSSVNPYKFKAMVDLKVIEALILSEDLQ